MRRKTETNRIAEAISNNLLYIEKAEIYNKTSGKTKTINTDKFKDNFDFLCESGCFLDAIGWHYERDYKTDSYEIEAGRMNPDADIMVTAYLGVCSGVSVENIEKILEVMEEE